MPRAEDILEAKIELVVGQSYEVGGRLIERRKPMQRVTDPAIIAFWLSKPGRVLVTPTKLRDGVTPDKTGVAAPPVIKPKSRVSLRDRPVPQRPGPALEIKTTVPDETAPAPPTRSPIFEKQGSKQEPTKSATPVAPPIAVEIKDEKPEAKAGETTPETKLGPTPWEAKSTLEVLRAAMESRGLKWTARDNKLSLVAELTNYDKDLAGDKDDDPAPEVAPPQESEKP